MLDYIVVDTFDQSEAALYYLKSQGQGWAGFIALDRLSNNIGGHFDQPAHFLRLYDLVHSSKEEYKKAFYLAMGDACVCNVEATFDLDNNRQFTVVTKSGEMIDENGLISGCGTPLSGLLLSDT